MTHQTVDILLGLSIFALTFFVLMALFCVTVIKGSITLLRLLSLCHVQVLFERRKMPLSAVYIIKTLTKKAKRQRKITSFSKTKFKT